MKKQKKNLENNIGYAITQIKTQKITIVEPDHLDVDKLTVTGEANLQVNAIGKGRTEILFDIITEYVNAKTNETLISHTGRTKYEAINVYIETERETLELPDQFMVMLYAMAHSHSRALLASDLQNTVYKDKIFTPVIDPKQVLKMKVEQ